MSTKQRWVLVLTSVASLMVALDVTVVSTALSSIRLHLTASIDQLEWTVNAYGLSFAVLLMTGSALGDRFGRRKLFAVGLALFVAASAACALATNVGMLIAARAVQGLGGAILSPAALSIVTTTFAEGADRNRALGIWGAVAGSGGAAGVLLGGVLTQWVGWQAVLFVNVPIGLLAAAAAPRLLPELERRLQSVSDLQSRIGGGPVFYEDIQAVSERDLRRASFI